MNLTIHRGAHEIGGNCIELASGETRILFDFGMPLVQPADKKKKFDSRDIQNKSAAELMAAGVLPPVTGLYQGFNGEKPVDALIISHPHQDHYGLAGYIRKEVPVYLAREAFKIIEVSDLFLSVKAHIKNPTFFEGTKPFNIGPFRITAYLMDHSAFGAYAFLVEAEGKRVFYSGDFRGHGRKAGLFHKFLRTAPAPVDCLLMEGTALNRPDGACKTESDLEEEIVKIARKYSNIKLVHVSGQNIDRIVTIFRAAKKTNSLFVVDLYTAYFLDELRKFAKIPYPNASFKNLRVFFSKRMMAHLYRRNRKDIISKFRPFEISAEELKAGKKGAFLIFRDTLLEDIKRIENFKDSVLIYSMYTGYMKEPRFEIVQQFLKDNGIALQVIHTSGHATFQDLKKMVSALRPETLVPIHTFEPQVYSKFHDNVRLLPDGEMLEI